MGGEEKKLWIESMDTASDALKECMDTSFQKVMNKYNRGGK